jgi:hypothetical protein
MIHAIGYAPNFIENLSGLLPGYCARTAFQYANDEMPSMVDTRQFEESICSFAFTQDPRLNNITVNEFPEVCANLNSTQSDDTGINTRGGNASKKLHDSIVFTTENHL